MAAPTLVVEEEQVDCFMRRPIGGKTVNGAGVDATVSTYPVVIGAGGLGGKGTYPSPNGDIGICRW